MQASQALRQHFGPQLQVELANHPPPPLQASLAHALLVLQFAAMAVVLAGQQAAPYLARVGIALPQDAWQGLQERKAAWIMGIFFIGNTLRQNLLSTGAFEVSYHGTPVWSKLDTGRMPTLADLIDGISEAMAAGRQ